MVSVPTSGTQLANAAVVFNAIFSAVGMKSEPNTDSEISGRGTVSLDKFQINLKEEEMEAEETLPAFVLENLTVTVQGEDSVKDSVRDASLLQLKELLQNKNFFNHSLKKNPSAKAI